MSFARKPLPKRERAMPTPVPVEHRRQARMVTPEDLAGVAVAETAPPPRARPKVKPLRSQAIKDSARGEVCTIRIPGCLGSLEGAVIASHHRGSAAGKGLATKSSDAAVAYGCTYCDAVYDGQRPRPPGWTQQDVELAWHEGHMRTLVRLREKGLL
jgi:hypothetical protein